MHSPLHPNIVNNHYLVKTIFDRSIVVFLTCLNVRFLFCYVSAATKSVVETDVALYVALVAASILLAGTVLLFRLYKNKGRDHSMYNMANSGTFYRFAAVRLPLARHVYNMYFYFFIWPLRPPCYTTNPLPFFFILRYLLPVLASIIFSSESWEIFFDAIHPT